MSIEELLNSDQESEVIDADITDKEIIKAVYAKYEALEKLEINGSNDNDDDIEVIEKLDH